ncbi:hypothetical protein LIER_18394 [Lithospermum erythrorhizon]|uniref:Reverse transcriptase domain-containing protein n=1 Tax=Lithospermum erythrorhizon TaxID=34254 RepID=A0AAV3QGE4_LITER
MLLERILRSELVRVSKAELELLRCKTMMNWLANGDFSTSFFNRSILASRNKYQISLLMDDDGRIHTDPQIVEIKIIQFYEALFTSKGVLSDAQKLIIRDSLIWREVKEDFQSIVVGKSPGPDGLSVEFYKYHWERVNQDLLDAFVYIFATGNVPPILNATTLSLVPKVDHPSSIRYYCPISCFNNVYKAITRILMRRMSGLMQELVSPSQSAFIPGRSFSDSVLLLQELVQGYPKEDGVPKAAIKVDLQKAYDIVEWDILWTGMLAMVFPQRFVFLLQCCITKANFSINLNGTMKGWFASIRGLRQGDPISLFLFILVLEIFNGLMRKASSSCALGFHRKFIEALCAYMEMHEGVLSIKYLGVPLSSMSLTHEDYSALISRVYRNIGSWQSRHLSLGGGGGAELVRSSIFGIQNFWCANLPLPKYVIEEVEKRVMCFLWSGKDEGPYRAKISSEDVCLQLAKGGLGFKQMVVWNQICLCKILWNIASKKDVLWKKILKVRPLVRSKYSVDVQDGSIPVSSDVSLRDALPLKLPGSRRQTIVLLRLVSEPSLISFSDGRDIWVWIGSVDGRFTQKSLWEEVRPRSEKLSWTKWLWGSSGIPRHEFVHWMLFHWTKWLWGSSEIGYAGGWWLCFLF